MITSKYIPICNICAAHLIPVVPIRSYHDALSAMRIANWRSFKQNGKWHNSCDKCMVEYARRPK